MYIPSPPHTHLVPDDEVLEVVVLVRVFVDVVLHELPDDESVEEHNNGAHTKTQDEELDHVPERLKNTRFEIVARQRNMVG